MFEIAGVRALSALLIVSMAVLLGACVHPVPPNSVGPRSWVVKDVANKTTPELYADWITPAIYERSASSVVGRYIVESGNLRMPDKSIGSLVTVRNANGSLTAVIEQKGKSGLVVINSKGQGTFTPYLPQDYSQPDTVSLKDEVISAKPESTATEPYVVDIFIGYSRSAVAQQAGIWSAMHWRRWKVSI